VNQHVMIIRVDAALVVRGFVLTAINSDSRKRQLARLRPGQRCHA